MASICPSVSSCPSCSHADICTQLPSVNLKSSELHWHRKEVQRAWDSASSVSLMPGVWKVFSEKQSLNRVELTNNENVFESHNRFKCVPSSCQRWFSRTFNWKPWNLTPLDSCRFYYGKKKRRSIVTYPGSFCWFQRERCFQSSPQWGQWWFLGFGPVIRWPPVGPRRRLVSASSHCHADRGRRRAIRRCQGDRWAGLGCSPRHRGCRKHRGGPGISLTEKRRHLVWCPD